MRKTRKPASFRAVQGLEERRCLSRVENPQDRREEFLSLTPLGVTTYRAIVPDMSAFEARLCAALGADDTQAMRHVLDRLEDVLGLAGAPPPD
ncbi:MarR family winged helix-turn-helix transcriptional regulator [Xanthobacter autotrophicus]|uniref:MarR family winged helix-turn-helix transcriptional regulator n=1 Tax=Xanthobacter autotrophicus TaxID=280 RepID=UPI0037265C52